MNIIMIRKKLTKSFFCILTITLTGCGVIQPLSRPLQQTTIVGPQSNGHVLWIFLPGTGDKPEKFVSNGFIKLLNNKYPEDDAVIVDLHTGYYFQKEIEPRMSQDVIKNALAKGYTKINIVGISLGGFGAIITAQHNEPNINSIILLAPYLGPQYERDFLSLPKEQWPTHEQSPVQWLLTQKNTDLILLYGESDRFVATIEQTISYLQKPQIYKVAGAHNWQTWHELWETFLLNE